jgi:hypothetical protein
MCSPRLTRSVRPIPTRLPLGAPEGLDVPRAAGIDNLQPIRRPFLTERVGALDTSRRMEALRGAAGARGLLVAILQERLQLAQVLPQPGADHQAEDGTQEAHSPVGRSSTA